MKKIYLILVLMLTMAQFATAQPKPQDSDTLWTKQLWQLGDNIEKVQFTPDGNNIAVGIGSGVYFYDIATGNLVKSFTGYNTGIWDFDLSEDGKRIVITSSDSKIILWDFEKGDTIRIINLPRSMAKIRFVNENLILCIGAGVPDSNTIQVWDMNTGKPFLITGTTGGPQQIALSKQNNIFALGTSGYNPLPFVNVELWDLNTFKYITRLGDQGNIITDLAFSPDGKYLASAG